MLHRGAPFRARLPSSWPRPLLRLCAGCPSCARTAVSIATSTVAACLQAMLRCVSSFLRVSSSRRLPALHFYGPQLGAWLTLETIPRTRPMALTASSRPGRQALACSELAAITTVCDKCPFSATLSSTLPLVFLSLYTLSFTFIRACVMYGHVILFSTLSTHILDTLSPGSRHATV